MAPELGPSELVLMAAAARRHYLDGQSKIDIAAALGISRFKVARMLEQARESGLVRIEIGPVGSIDADLAARLQERYALTHCAVVCTDGIPNARHQVGAVAGRLLGEIVTDADVLGLPWARSIADMLASMTRLPPVPIVQLSGALVLPGETSSPVDLVSRAARLAGGEAHVFYAPMLLDDAASAEAMLRQPSIAAALAQIPRVTKAVVGVGAWTGGSSTIYQVAADADRAALAESGVVGEAAGVFFDAGGHPLRTLLDERLITVRAEQLLAVPEVIGVASGTAKAAAIRASVLQGLVDSLVVDTEIATRMVAAEPDRRR